MKPAMKPVDNSKKSVTPLQTPLSKDLVKVLENYRIARLSLPGKWRRNVQIKKRFGEAIYPIKCIKRVFIPMRWWSSSEDSYLTFRWRNANMPGVWREAEHRKLKRISWKGADCASVWLLRGTKNSQSFHGWGCNQSATPICCPTQWPRNYLSKAICHWNIYFSCWELPKLNQFR